MAARVARVAAKMKMETSTRIEKQTQQRKAARALLPGGFSNLTF
jgi:hypothetical protein